LSSVEAGMGMEGRTIRVHRTMYILDDITGVCRSSKCTKIVGGRGFTPDPTKEFTALPDP